MELKIIQDTPEPVQETLCEICEKQFSKYVCPRCNLRYCSLTCYKDMRHADCTESFYKQSVTEEIKSRDIDKESKNKMLEMLKRLEEEKAEEDVLEDDEYDELLEKFNDLDIDNADPELIWNMLSEKERQEFRSMVSKLDDTWHRFDLPDYIPWWMIIQQSRIQDMTESTSDDHRIPQLPDNLPDFNKMIQPSTRGSPHLIWNMIHILATYSYLMRHSMGELLEDIQDTVHVIETVSAEILFSTAASCPFGSIHEVIDDIVERILRFQEQSSPAKRRMAAVTARYDLKILIIHDLLKLVPERKRAMFDFWHALDQISKKRKKRSVGLAVRKLYFYWAAACAFEDMELVLASLRSILSKIEIEKTNFEQDREAAQRAIREYQKAGSTAKIQEI
ncbi:hypothetical protein RMCBS344292_07040 [Rhizopus microsporus]|nr:hypothetical protein RMCBS344292_07040 [Rhizopus microsporus]